MKRTMEKYADQVYRPGDDISKLDNLTSEEMIERRLEIEAAFAEHRTYNTENDDE